MLREALGGEMMKRATDSYSAVFGEISTCTYAIQPRSLRWIKGCKCLEGIRFRNNKIVHEYMYVRRGKRVDKRGKVNEVDEKQNGNIH